MPHVPDDFPRDVRPASPSGAQPKLVARLIDGKFIVGQTNAERFERGKQVASYLGLIPSERTTGGRQRTGSISKQGNRFLRMLLVESATVVVRCDPGFRNEYLHRCHKKPKAVAKVAAARKLAIRLYWMLRTNTAYPEIVRMESSSRVPLAG